MLPGFVVPVVMAGSAAFSVAPIADGPAGSPCVLSDADRVDAMFGWSRAPVGWLTGLAGAVELPFPAASEDAVPGVLAMPSAGVAEPVLVIDPVTWPVGELATAG